MIKVEHLTKKYGEVLALDDLSFEIEEGQVYGFLGPNGAGKSTTMNIMTGCLSATAGSVTIGGHDVFEEPDAAKRLVGYLPEQPPLYMNETPLEYLRFVGEAKGLRGAELTAQIDEVAEQAGTSGVMRRRIGDLSKGYWQRVGIAQALLGEPRVIILDEPTVGAGPDPDHRDPRPDPQPGPVAHGHSELAHSLGSAGDLRQDPHHRPRPTCRV